MIAGCEIEAGFVKSVDFIIKRINLIFYFIRDAITVGVKSIVVI